MRSSLKHQGNGLIPSPDIARGFHSVDRKYFVPEENVDSAHSDMPLKEGNIHISAPHIYASVLEALELQSDSCQSFLNVGSGTGYLSCIVAQILGFKSINFGIEIHKEAIDHCQKSIAKWKTSRNRLSSRKRRSVSTTRFAERERCPNIEIIHGNGLQITSKSGMAIVGFDRIYIGAAVDHKNLTRIKQLLSPGGILVGPVDDELVKIVRFGPIHDSKTQPTENGSSLSGSIAGQLNEDEFTQQTLSGVRFSPLLKIPKIHTIIPARVWNLSRHTLYPDTFQRSSMALFLCSHSDSYQSSRPALPKNNINLASYIPKDIWVHILSFTHGKWFESEQTGLHLFKKRLVTEQSFAAKAQEARADAEARATAAERERDIYRVLARRWQTRVQDVLQRQRQNNPSTTTPQDSSNTELPSIESIFNDEIALPNIGMMLQQSHGDDDEGGDNDSLSIESNGMFMDAQDVIMDSGEESRGDMANFGDTEEHDVYSDNEDEMIESVGDSFVDADSVAMSESSPPDATEVNTGNPAISGKTIQVNGYQRRTVSE